MPFNGLPLTKVYIVWVKKVQRSYVWWHWILMQWKYEGKLSCTFKNYMSSFGNFYQSNWKSPNWDFYVILFSKVEILWAYNLQGSYLSWQWWMMQNYRRNWLVLSNLTSGIWQILTRALENIKNLHFNGLFLISVFNVLAKNLQRSYIHATEGWCNIWRKTDLYFPKWQEEFVKFSFTGWKIAISF